MALYIIAHRLDILFLMRHVLSFELLEAGFLPLLLPHRYIAISKNIGIYHSILMFLIFTEPEICDQVCDGNAH